MTTFGYLGLLIAWRRAAFWTNFAAWTFFHLLPLFYGLLIRALLDAASGNAAAGWNPWTLLALYASTAGLRQATFFVAFRLFNRYFLSVQAFVRRNLLDHLLLAPGSRRLPESPSEAVSRFRDDVDDIAVYAESWIDAGGMFLYGICALAVLFSVNPLIASIVCAPLFLMMLVMRRLSPVIRTYRKRMREATARVTDFIGETFGAVEAVKVASAEDSMTRQFASLGEERRRRALADVLLTEMIRGLNNGLVFTGTGVVLLMAASRIGSGELTAGGLALFIQVLPRLTNVLTFSGDMMAQHRRMKVATDRMEHLLVDADPSVIMKPEPLPLTGPAPTFVSKAMDADRLHHLTIRGLSYHYSKDKPGIEDIDFEVNAGDFTVITGRVGSGKSTLLRVLQGLLPRHSGQIVWNGREVEDPASFFQPPRSSYAAQTPRLFSETLRDNVMLGDPDQEERLDRAIHLAALAPDIVTLENGLDTLVGTRGVKLSGGQMQRTSAARMFAREAELMIFDDLSSALDAATERQLWENLAERQTTCLVVSHRRPALLRATQILLMKDGRIIARGSLNELLESQEEMRRLWDAPDAQA
jgi:ABC-type multidrug transport system fused ATPase/permease subunit